jgi:SAM-dependent methyltransferase
MQRYRNRNARTIQKRLPERNWSLRVKVAKKRLRRAIAKELGAADRRPLETATNPLFQSRFHPHSEKGPIRGYPLYQIGHELSKLPRETIGNFVDIPKLVHDLRQIPAIGTLLHRHPKLEQAFEQSVRDMIRERGIKGSKFWETAPKTYIDAIVAGGKGKPNLMNDRVGMVAKRLFGETVRPRTILDIGTFAGGTIAGAVKALSLQQRQQLRLVLVDVNERVIREYAIPTLAALGVPRQNIVVLPTSFYSAAVAFGQMRKPLHEKGLRRFAKQFKVLAGKVDLITAGAATLNFANDLQPLLQSVRVLLKPGGGFVDWEWGSAEARTPTVNIPELKKKIVTIIDGKPLTEFDAYVSFLDFWMGSPPDTYFAYPEIVKQKLWHDIEHATQFNFFDWCERNRDWTEAERLKAGGKVLADPAGFRNRAYRDGRAMTEVAVQHGLLIESLEYPFAKPSEKTTGNVNWMLVARK